MSTVRTVEEAEARNIRSLALMEAADFFRDSDEIVAKILDEFAFRASQGLDIVTDDEYEEDAA